MPPYPDHLYDQTPEDPIAVIAPFLGKEPTTVVIGGLGDGNEGVCAKRRWPRCKLIGIDMDPRAVEYQAAHGWPFSAPLWKAALSDRVGEARYNPDVLNCASLHPSMLEIARPDELKPTATTTLDLIETHYGPFDDCLLWLDLEGYDYKALCGGKRLLSSGRVMAINVETRYCHEPENRALSALLCSLGYVRVYVHFRQWWGHNELWVRQELFPGNSEP